MENSVSPVEKNYDCITSPHLAVVSKLSPLKQQTGSDWLNPHSLMTMSDLGYI